MRMRDHDIKGTELNAHDAVVNAKKKLSRSFMIGRRKRNQTVREFGEAGSA
jgi:hypothetical protein